MSLISTFDQADHEANHFDTETEEGSSTVQFLAAAAKRGARGMRIIIVGDANEAYVIKDDVFVLADGETKYIGFWLKTSAVPTDRNLFLLIRNSLDVSVFAYQHRSDPLSRIWMKTDSSAAPDADYAADLNAAWYWIALELTRSATVGAITLYVDGTERAAVTGEDNLDTIGAGALSVRIGIPSAAEDGYVVDIDDLVLSSTYPIPPSPRPSMADVLLLLQD